MAKFYVYEVQEEIAWRQWRYEVEAATEEEALALAKEGFSEAVGDPEDYGAMDDLLSTGSYRELGKTIGWAVRDHSDEAFHAFREAAQAGNGDDDEEVQR